MATYQLIQINNDGSTMDVGQYIEANAPATTLGGTLASLIFTTGLDHYSILLSE